MSDAPSVPAIIACVAALAGRAGAAQPLFEDVTKEAGITFRHETGATGRLHYPEIMASGVILFDYDGDGDLDIYFLNGNYLADRPPDPAITDVLYRNDSAGGAIRYPV